LDNIKSDHILDEYLQLIKDYKAKLGKSKKRIEFKSICYNPEINSENYLHDHTYHKDVRIIPSSNFNSDGSIERGLLNFLIASMVESQIDVMDDTIEFLEEQIMSISDLKKPEGVQENNTEKENSSESNLNVIKVRGFERIKFLTKVNVLGTLFYDLLDKGYIDTTSTNIIKFLNESFSDVKGKAINKNTIETILKPDNEDKRANENVRINVPDL
jgi:hypothetical protein